MSTMSPIVARGCTVVVIALALWMTEEYVRLAIAVLASLIWVTLATVPTEVATKPNANRRDICHDRYHSSKVPQDVDIVVIGAGTSGLAFASLMARCGKKVVVLEQHTVIGGASHMFELGDGYLFDSGLHYTVPESGDILKLCTGEETSPVPFDKLFEGELRALLRYLTSAYASVIFLLCHGYELIYRGDVVHDLMLQPTMKRLTKLF